MEDFDEAALERQMRRALFFNGPRQKDDGLSPEERQMAANLLSTSEPKQEERQQDRQTLRKLQSLKWGGVKSRDKPKVVSAEYYQRPGDLYRGAGWVIDIRVNGILHRSSPPLDRDECMKWIASLSRKGVQIRPIVTEWMKANPTRPAPRPQKQESARKAMLDEIGSFKP